VLDLCNLATVLDAGLVVKTGPPAMLLADQALMESNGLEVPWPLRSR